MSKYIVKSPVKSGGKIREIGDVVELDDAIVAPLLAAGNVELQDPKAAFQQAMKNAESAARALEQAGGDPGEVAAELRRQEADQSRALAEALDEVAKVVATGEIGVDDAASQVCAQVPSAKPAEVLIVLQQKVAQLREQQAAGTRGTEARPPAENKTDAKPEKKKK